MHAATSYFADPHGTVHAGEAQHLSTTWKPKVRCGAALTQRVLLEATVLMNVDAWLDKCTTGQQINGQKYSVRRLNDT